MHTLGLIYQSNLETSADQSTQINLPQSSRVICETFECHQSHRTKDISSPCFCHKIMFYYVRKAHRLTLLSLSPALSLTDAHNVIVCTHLNISANVVSTTLTILSVTV